MEKNCLYCESHFTTARSNKKYCSDNCKQMAYFKRNGLVLSGTVKSETLSYKAPVVQEQIVKYDLETPSLKNETIENPTVKCETTQQRNVLDIASVETLLNRLTKNLERKFEQTIENVKQELSVKYGLDITKKETPELVAESPAENHQIKIIDLYEDNEEEKENNLFEFTSNEERLGNQTETEEENEIGVEEIIKQQKEEIQKLKAEIEALKREMLEDIRDSEEEEMHYEWIESKFTQKIEKQILAESKTHLFNQRIKGWNYQHLESVNWVNIRLRCLVESMIKLSNYGNIDKHTLLCMNDAFHRLVKSNAFRTLPENYPYIELIKELFIKLHQLLKNNEFSENLKFSLAEKLKTKLIAIRYEMMKFIPAMKFSEMDFIETSIHDPLTKKESELKRMPDWYWRYKAMKKEKERIAA